MTDAFDREPSMRALTRWAGAAIGVITAHLGAVWIALALTRTEAASGRMPPAVMIDLAPLPATQAPPPVDAAPGPERVQAQPESDLPEPELPELPPVEEPAFDPLLRPDPLLDLKLPDVPPVPDAAAVLAPLPPPPKRIEPTGPPQKKVEKTERKKKESDKPKAKRAAAPPASDARRTDQAAANAPDASSVSDVAAATWKSAVGSHIRRFIAAPGGARSGSVVVTFNFDRSGRILATRVARSSGQDILDRQALTNVQDASPIPPPPPEVTSLIMTVPIQFRIR